MIEWYISFRLSEVVTFVMAYKASCVQNFNFKLRCSASKKFSFVKEAGPKHSRPHWRWYLLVLLMLLRNHGN